MPLLPRSFYARDVVTVARELLGQELRRDGVALRITEVEAYAQDDTACHARAGRTERNAALWGPPGRAYVYLCYGLHNMLNLVAEEDGRAAAVLVRSCEVIEGFALIRRRRGGKEGPELLTGPGKIGQALALDPSWSHHELFRAGGLTVHRASPPSSILAGPRIGIDYASAQDRARPWRFAAAGTEWVTHPERLGLRAR
jgi:DNA-3-methyladenine glycosylase